MTTIEWTRATDGTPGKTWNPTRGCSPVSPGCANCFAMKQAHRFSGTGKPYDGLTKLTVASGPQWTGEVRFVPEMLGRPLRWKRPRMVFVNSMSDLFHDALTNEQIAAVFGVMAACPQHTFQVLTKRPERMRSWFRWAGDGSVVEQMREVALAGRVAEVFAEERVKPVRGWPGYFVTSSGRVLSDRKGPRREMKPMAGESGHERVMLYRGDGESSRPLIQRLVLEHFDRPPKDGEQACHIDGHPSNNQLWNLRWGSQSDNWQDRKRHGNRRSYQKLSRVDVDMIRQRLADGETAEAISRSVDVSATQVRNIASGAQWAEQHTPEWPLKSVWLGVSAEDQKRWDERVPILLDTPAAIRWVSAEPLLGPIAMEERQLLGAFDRCPDEYRPTVEGDDDPCMGCPGHGDECGAIRGPSLDWIVVGGESGSRSRACDVDWVRSVVTQCEAADVPCFVKQLGSHPIVGSDSIPTFASAVKDRKGGDPEEWPPELRVRQYPEVRP